MSPDVPCMRSYLRLAVRAVRRNQCVLMTSRAAMVSAPQCLPAAWRPCVAVAVDQLTRWNQHTGVPAVRWLAAIHGSALPVACLSSCYTG